MSARLIATILFMAACAPTPSVTAQSLRTVPLDHWAYEYADALILRHPEMEPGIRFSNRPWTQGDFLEIVAAARDLAPEFDDLSKGWMSALEREFETAPQGVADSLHYYNLVGVEVETDLRTEDATFDPPFRDPTFDSDLGEPLAQVLLRHDFAVQHSGFFVLGWSYVIDQNVRNDPSRRSVGQRGTDASFEVLDAYARFRAGPLWFTLGRHELSLGPGRGTSVFVSDSIPAMDQVRFEIRTEPLQFTGLLTQLSRERPNRLLDETGDTIEGSQPSESDPIPFDVTRWLYLHRIDWQVSERLQLSVGEAALVAGIDRGVELRYANPLLPFFLGQTENDEGDGVNVNVVVNVDGSFRGPARTLWYGDLYAQEIFIDREKRDRIGNQLAWRVGLEWGDPGGATGTTVGAEYTRVGVFTYLHRGLNTNWSTFGVPIGSSLGPDADQAILWVERWLNPNLRIGGDATVRRGGERSIRTLESVIDAGNPPFPSGVVQREYRVGVTSWGRWPDLGLEARVRVERREVKNIASDPGRDGGFWEAEADVYYRWRIQ